MVQEAEKPICFLMECEAQHYRSLPPVTTIRLQGLWLERMGFHSGDKIVVTSKKGEILLRLAGHGSYDVTDSATW